MTSVVPNVGNQTKLSELVSFWCEKTPNNRAIAFENQVLTYQDFADQIDIFAKQLLALGVTQGDVVALYANSSSIFAIHLFACARIGAIWLGLNPKYSASELGYILDNAGPTCIWLESDSEAEANEQVQLLFKQRSNVWTCSAKNTSGDAQFTLAPYSNELASQNKKVVLADREDAKLPCLSTIDANSPAILIYTSGTTGSPKGAVISQYALTTSSILQAKLLQLDSPTILNNLPINHIGAVGDITTSMIANGGCIVMQSRFDVREGFRLIKEHGITIWGQIPTMFQLALEHEDFATADLSSIQTVLFSGAPASIDLVRKLRKICPNLINTYGMSETVGAVTWAINESDHILANTIGRPVPSVDFRLADEEGVTVGAGEKGEIQIRSDYNFSYYWRDETATSETFTADGFLKTGDIGQENADGTITLIGRTKERFKSGGYNVYPREIEQVITEHSKVIDCVVVSVPDPLYHEVGYAFVIVKSSETLSQDELKAHCKKSLANYKVPKYIEFLMHFPQLANGKINRKALAAIAAEKLLLNTPT